MSIPQGTTHVWTPAIQRPTISPALSPITVTRLGYYRKKRDGWWVFSDQTGWRKARNTLDWFLTERNEGYLVTVKQYQREDFVAKEE